MESGKAGTSYSVRAMMAPPMCFVLYTLGFEVLYHGPYTTFLFLFCSSQFSMAGATPAVCDPEIGCRESP